MLIDGSNWKRWEENRNEEEEDDDNEDEDQSTVWQINKWYTKYH